MPCAPARQALRVPGEFAEPATVGLVTSNAWERVVKLESDTQLGAGTIVEHGGRTYCVTARHVLPPNGEIRLSTRYAEWGGEFDPIVGIHPEADVAVFEVPDRSRRVARR